VELLAIMKKARISLAEVQRLSRLNPTHSELAAYFGVSLATIDRRFRDDEKFRKAVADGNNERKTSLRRLQWEAATKGNTAMLIFLGKNELDQRDVAETQIKVTPAIDAPPKPANDISQWLQRKPQLGTPVAVETTKLLEKAAIPVDGNDSK